MRDIEKPSYEQLREELLRGQILYHLSMAEALINRHGGNPASEAKLAEIWKQLATHWGMEK